MPILKEDIRFVLWTGIKFLFFGREDFRVISSGIVDLYNESMTMKDYSEFIEIIPASCTTRLGLDGSGTASLSFVASPGKYDFRFSAQSQITLPWIRSRDQSLFREKMLKEYIKPYKNYYKHLGTFTDEYMNADRLYSEPTFLFSPPQVIWIEMKRGDYDTWRRVFTGLVNHVEESEVPGQGALINMTCDNLLQLTERVPLCYEKQVVPFAKIILPSGTPENDEFSKFWMMYLMSLFLDVEHTGWNPIAEMSLSEIFIRFSRAINRACGALSENDFEQLKEILNDERVQTAFGEGYIHYLTPETVDDFKLICKKYSFYRFKIFGTHLPESDIMDVFQGQDNSVSDELTLGELFQAEQTALPYMQTGTEYAVGKVMFNKTVRDLDIKDKLASQQQSPRAFQKMFRLSMGSFFKPKYAFISNVVRRISTAYGFMSHNDGFGNWILEYPNFNALPKIDSGDVAEEAAYIDADGRYIIQQFDCTSLVHTTDPSRFITYVELPFQYNIAGHTMPEVLQNKFTGRNWGSVEQIMQFGLNEVSLDALYFTVGTLTGNDETREFLYQLTEHLRERMNAEAWSAATQHKLRPDLQIGRNAIIAHKEKKYMIWSIAHAVNPGREASTSLALTHGRNLDKQLVDPWNYFYNHIIDIEDPTNYEDLDYSVTDEGYVYSTDAAQLATQIQQIAGQAPPDPAMMAEYIKKLSPYLKPGIGKKVTKDKILGLDARLLLALGKVHDRLCTWVQQKFQTDVPPILSISGGWRDCGVQWFSRHCAARAIDINGVYISWGSRKNQFFKFNANPVDPFTNTIATNALQKVIPELVRDYFVQEGFLLNQSEKQNPYGNVVYWNFPAWAADSPKGGDILHLGHIHASVGRRQRVSGGTH